MEFGKQLESKQVYFFLTIFLPCKKTLRWSERAQVCLMFPQLLLWIVVIFDSNSVLPLILLLGFPSIVVLLIPIQNWMRCRFQFLSCFLVLWTQNMQCSRVVVLSSWIHVRFGCWCMKTFSAAQLGVSLSFPLPSLFVFVFPHYFWLSFIWV